MGKNDKIHSSVMAGVMTQLWRGNLTTDSTTINLSDSILNYEMLLVVGTGNQYSNHAISNLLPVFGGGGEGYVVSSSQQARLMLNGSTYLTFLFPTATTIRATGGFSVSSRLTAVYGLFPKN